MGDDFVRYGFPFIDVSSGGSVQGMIAATEKVAAELPADAKVIPVGDAFVPVCAEAGDPSP